VAERFTIGEHYDRLAAKLLERAARTIAVHRASSPRALEPQDVACTLGGGHARQYTCARDPEPSGRHRMFTDFVSEATPHAHPSRWTAKGSHAGTQRCQPGRCGPLRLLGYGRG
jgi:hypothetical protein